MTAVPGFAADGDALAWLASAVAVLVVTPRILTKPVVAVAVQPVPTAGVIAGAALLAGR
jgi:hypothetical protein